MPCRAMVQYTLLYNTIECYTILSLAAVLYYTILYYTMSYFTILYQHHTMPCCAMVYCILYCTIPHYTILYQIIPYYAMLCYAIAWHTIPYCTKTETYSQTDPLVTFCIHRSTKKCIRSMRKDWQQASNSLFLNILRKKKVSPDWTEILQTQVKKPNSNPIIRDHRATSHKGTSRLIDITKRVH